MEPVIKTTMLKKDYITIKGFTLVEILVVLGLFSLISTIALGTLFNAQSINARLQESQSILDNINLSTQTLLRDIRLGSDFYCATSLPASVITVRKNCSQASGSDGGSVLMFRSADNASSTDRVAYYLKNGVLYKNEYKGVPVASSTFQITSGDVLITSLSFYVDGAQTSDGSNDDGGVSDTKQPLITVSISGHAKSFRAGTLPPEFTIQTHISARELDK
jgi:prepilin-type N-terminal cleavage/methylation domain-containing protein